MRPFTKEINHEDGTILNAALIVTRRLSDLKGLFEDKEAEATLLRENPVIYQVFEATKNPKVAGHLQYSTTVIHPGKVGNQYFMTKGHYHAKASCGELYFGLAGEGYILLQTPKGRLSYQYIKPNSLTYVPPSWAHRAVNTGSSNLSFLAVYPADAGYDYATIAENGFSLVVVEKDGGAKLLRSTKTVEN